MRTYEPTDRVLIDLRDQRTDLAIRIGLLKDATSWTKLVLVRLQLDRRIVSQPKLYVTAFLFRNDKSQAR